MVITKLASSLGQYLVRIFYSVCPSWEIVEEELQKQEKKPRIAIITISCTNKTRLYGVITNGTR
jgi:hypothetical protein